MKTNRLLWAAGSASLLTLLTACPAVTPLTPADTTNMASPTAGPTSAVSLSPAASPASAASPTPAASQSSTNPSSANPSPTATPSPGATASATPAPSSSGGQAPVAMSTLLNNFAVLAGSTVTNSGATTVNGDLGVSPGSAIVGFAIPGGPGQVNGTQHDNDPTATQAKSDLNAAYNDAKSRSTAPVSEAGNLGGMTLAPGLYVSQSSLAISSGDLTLDAKGNPNAVWIFEMASTLTTTSGRAVILSGGAKANNVFWQVGSSATLGTTSSFKGNILAAVSITMNTGATLEGRALTQTGAVALNANTITKPAS